MGYSADHSAPITLALDDSLVSFGIGPYELVGELARGGMGTVYLCQRVGVAGFHRLFAIKVIHEHLAQDEAFVGMLQDEARIAACIHHHNVVAIVDLGVDAAGHYVVMEYIEGCSMAQMWSGEEPPPVRLVVTVMIDALNGLHAAHTAADYLGRPMCLVHRDVSPQNILVGIDGVGRITDFGIAAAHSRITSTRPGVHKGKLAYAAPEQLDGTAEIDARVDVFAAGVVLWSVLTGRKLFGGRSDAETLNRLLHQQVPAPSRVRPSIPPILDHICMRALERDRELRYPSAAAMADALREAAAEASCLASSTEISDWVALSFCQGLAARRAAIREIRLSGNRWGPAQLPALRAGSEGGDGLEAFDSAADTLAPERAASAEPARAPTIDLPRSGTNEPARLGTSEPARAPSQVPNVRLINDPRLHGWAMMIAGLLLAISAIWLMLGS